jgi:hypothetical protein
MPAVSWRRLDSSSSKLVTSSASVANCIGHLAA